MTSSQTRKALQFASVLSTLTPTRIKQQGHRSLFTTFGIPVCGKLEAIMDSNPNPDMDGPQLSDPGCQQSPAEMGSAKDKIER
jgi:hypothetical protein